jgi:hypothetical protein
MARSFVKALGDLLTPLGFERSGGDDWTRVRGDMWECVNRQASWMGVTVNLLMKDLETEKLFLAVFGAGGAVQMPPVSRRVGELIDGYDRWWKSDEPDAPKEMAEAVLQYGLPWFDRVRTLEQQAEHWYGRKTILSARGYHGMTYANLALTLYRMGETAEACETLRKPVPKMAIPSGVKMAATMREWLGCDGIKPKTVGE